MKINPHIFRAYDIRGIAQTSEKHPSIDLTEEVAETLGACIGLYIQQKYGRNIVVGCDNRLTSEKLKEAFIEGLRSQNGNVTDIGLLPSPLLYFAVCHYGFDGGINITASHNPKEYNGFKIVGAKGHSICGEEIQTIRNLAEKFQKTQQNATGNLQKKEISEDYIEFIKTIVPPQKSIKIVMDAGNGTMGKFAPKVLKSFGHTVIEQCCELDGNFPNHPANPEEYENVIDLIERVKKEKADLGIAFDGDGDRIGMVDENGHFYAADYMLLLLSRDVLARHKGAKIVYDLKSSQILAEEITKLGGIPIMAKTGHSFIEQTMKKEKALLGGEVSGHMFFAENYYGFDDAMLAALKIIEIVTHSGKKLSEHFHKLPKTFITPEIKVPCSDDKKFAIVEKIKNEFERKHQCITIDGIRIDFGEGAWGIVRSSNTSPYLTLRFEARNEQKLREIQKIVFDALKQYPEVDNSWYKKILEKRTL